MKELKVPALQALVVKAYLMKQSDADLREMSSTIVMIADRLRPLMAEVAEVTSIEEPTNGR